MIIAPINLIYVFHFKIVSPYIMFGSYVRVCLKTLDIFIQRNFPTFNNLSFSYHATKGLSKLFLEFNLLQYLLSGIQVECWRDSTERCVELLHIVAWRHTEFRHRIHGCDMNLRFYLTSHSENVHSEWIYRWTMWTCLFIYTFLC